MRLNLIPVCSCIVEYNNTGGLFSIDKKIQNISIVSNDFSYSFFPSPWNLFFLFKFHFPLVFCVVDSFLFYCFFFSGSSDVFFTSLFLIFPCRRFWDCERIHGLYHPCFLIQSTFFFTNCSRGLWF